MTARRVVKLGGSLLAWPGCVPAFLAWQARQTPAVTIVIAGGGALVDALAELESRQGLRTETTHWLAIRAMGITATAASEMLGNVPVMHELAELRQASAPGLRVFDAEPFLREEAGTAEGLRCGWEVTSDSIAARVAATLDAGELVLLKSGLPADESRETLAEQGYVDRDFPRVSQRLHVRCVNLRDPALGEVTLAPSKVLELVRRSR